MVLRGACHCIVDETVDPGKTADWVCDPNPISCHRYALLWFVNRPQVLIALTTEATEVAKLVKGDR